MAGAAVTVKGGEQLAASLRKAGANIGRMTATSHKAATVVANRARVLCPVDTGALRGSIRSVHRLNAFEVVASENLPYGAVQEFGWPAHNIRARYYMTGAARDTQPEVIRIYSEEIAKVIGEVHGA